MEEEAFSTSPDLDAIEVIEPGEEASAGHDASGDASDPEMASVTVPHDAMPFEEWYQEAWIGGHEVANLVLRTQSLAEAPRAPQGRRAALGLYRTCCRVSLLHFVIAPGPQWTRDVAAVAVYAYFTGAGVAAEFADRKAAASPKAAGGESPAKPGQHDFAAKA